ncbi:MAG: hypothetical protein ACLTQI_09840 [Slackia sp.]
MTYGVDALRAVTLRGADLAAVGFDLAALWGFLALFFALAAFSFRKNAPERHAEDPSVAVFANTVFRFPE